LAKIGSKISAVLLAAGQSRRMGADNKLLLPIDGEPVVRATAGKLLAAGVAEIVVVLGHEADLVAAALDGLAVRTVINPDHRDGQMTSVRAGLAALGAPVDGIMICLADQPFVEAEDYRALIAAFAAVSEKSVVVPTHGGRRGNPIVLAAAHRNEILARGANLGCKQFIARNPDLVATVAFDTDAFVRDIDTPADYRETVER
jgi:molybdenum cofactor cytidylyltransferase